MSYLDRVRAQLREDEDCKFFPYEDTEKNITIGIGRNLTGTGLRPDEVQYLFENDLRDADRLARSLVSGFDNLAEARQVVLVDMAFNLGSKLKGFINFLRYVNSGQWGLAVREMMNSRWHIQTGVRAARLETMMQEGK